MIEISGLDIGEVIIAGLISLGRLPEPTKLTKYEVEIRGRPSFFNRTPPYTVVSKPSILVYK